MVNIIVHRKAPLNKLIEIFNPSRCVEDQGAKKRSHIGNYAKCQILTSKP